MNLDHFYLNRLRFTIEALEPIALPPYKGTTLRGGFGITFRRLVCYQPEMPSCDDCLLRFSCPYPSLFETFVPPDAPALRNLTRVPPPLVIEPPPDAARLLGEGEALTFHVTLVGQAERYLSYLVVAFQELGRRGLGKDRGRFRLQEVAAVHPYSGESATIYHQAQPAMIRHEFRPLRFAECAARVGAWPEDGLRIYLQTPTRLKDGGLYLRGPGLPFDSLWRALMRRVSSLAAFHCGRPWAADYRALAEMARGIASPRSDLAWVNYDRFSTRQMQKVALSGLVGSVDYEGDLHPFRPLLALGEFVHVGKGTIFGNGQMRVTAVAPRGPQPEGARAVPSDGGKRVTEGV